MNIFIKMDFYFHRFPITVNRNITIEELRKQIIETLPHPSHNLTFICDGE